MPDEPKPEATRLEELWAGEFGDEYVERNRQAGEVRAGFWKTVCERTAPASVLEVGCNLGGNLGHVAGHVPPHHVFGVDVNLKALNELRRSFSDVNAVHAPARELPFRDRWFDLVFTMGVLIHQPEATLPLVLSEMARTARRWILMGEYFAETTTEVPYRGHSGALFRRDYGGIFADLFPDFVLEDKGFLGRDEGWDDVTWWLFRRA
jgi:spore coat polysaccharide biosynthesis protein SpsF